MGGTDVKGVRDLGGRPGEGSRGELRALQVKEGIAQRESISAMTVSEEGGFLGMGDWTLGVGGRERPSGSGTRRRPSEPTNTLGLHCGGTGGISGESEQGVMWSCLRGQAGVAGGGNGLGGPAR